MSIKKKFITYIIGFTFIFSMVSVIANADTITVEIKEINEQKYVSLTDLTNAYEGTIIDNSDVGSMIYNLNGKVITVNNKTAFTFVDNNLIPLETKEVSGIILPNLNPEKPQSDSGEILFPVSIIETYVGIKVTDEGFIIEPEKVDEEAESTPTYNTTSYDNTSYYDEEFYIEAPEVYEAEYTTPTTNNTSNSGSPSNSTGNSNNSSSGNSSNNTGTSNSNSSGSSNGSSSDSVQTVPETPPITEPEPTQTPEQPPISQPESITQPTQPTQPTQLSEPSESS